MRSLFAMVLIFFSAFTFAHHGYGGRYDREVIAEIEGELVQKIWRNPHVRLTLKDTQGNLWNLEAGTASRMIERGLTQDLISVGDFIRIAGFPSTAGHKEMIVRNILLPSGYEIVLDPNNLGPRWQKTNLIVGANKPRVTVGDQSSPELGIFRTWSTVTRDPASKEIFPESVDASLVWQYPLTPEAITRLKGFDAARDNPLAAYCIGKGMPMIMDQPFATVFTNHGDTIVLQLEEFDAVRTIHMNDDVQAPLESSKFGFSRGAWDGETLVVETRNISWPYFSQMGVPQTDQSIIVERFTPADQGSKLNYQLVATDPAIFTKPVILEKYWIWDPSIELVQYDCVD